jgi:hypothetical protein
MLKIAAEEAWRERNHEALQGVLDLVLADALEGDKSARKLIFDALISKANVSEDKAAGQKQTIGAPALSNNFKGQKPADAKAPLIDGGGKFTPSTSQSNIRGPQGQ